MTVPETPKELFFDFEKRCDGCIHASKYIKVFDSKWCLLHDLRVNNDSICVDYKPKKRKNK